MELETIETVNIPGLKLCYKNPDEQKYIVKIIFRPENDRKPKKPVRTSSSQSSQSSVSSDSSDSSQSNSGRKSYELEINGNPVFYDIYSDIKHNPSAKLVYEIWRRQKLKKFVLFIKLETDIISRNELYVVSRKIEKTSVTVNISETKDEQSAELINPKRHKRDSNPKIYLMEFLTGIHSLGFTHGDFTNTNILRDNDRLYVIDFERSVDAREMIDDLSDFRYLAMFDYADLIRSLGHHYLVRYIEPDFVEKIKRIEGELPENNWVISPENKKELDKLNIEMMNFLYKD